MTYHSPHPGHYIREELDARGWSVADLATASGLGETLVLCITLGEIRVDACLSKALAKAFNVDADLFSNLQNSADAS